MVLRIIGILLDHLDPQKNDVWKLWRDKTDFYH